MIRINAINLDEESISVFDYTDDDTAKAIMFDNILNKDFEYSYVEIVEVNEGEYNFSFKINNDSTVYGNGFEIDYCNTDIF